MHPAQVDHVPEVLSRFDHRPANVTATLQAIIDQYTYLPNDAVRQVAVKLRIPIAQVLQVASKLADPNRVVEPVDV